MAKPTNTRDKYDKAIALATSGVLPVGKNVHIRNFKPENLYTLLQAFGYRWDRALREWRQPAMKEPEAPDAAVVAAKASATGFEFQVRIIAHKDHIEQVLESFEEFCLLFDWRMSKPDRYYPADSSGIQVRVYLYVHVEG